MLVSNIERPYVVELVTYHLNEDADEGGFLSINRQVGEHFTQIQTGFLLSEICRKENGSWLIAVFWKTAEDARNFISNIDQVPETFKPICQ